METNKNIFKAGDKVFDYTYGWGVVDEANDINARVKFDSSSNNTVLYWGIFLKTLSFTEYTLEGFSQERPEELPKKGQIVWGRDKDYQSWHIYHFSHKSEDGLYHLSSDNSRSAYILKQITTENPYENEQL